jgi:hypothetical protein
VVKSIDFDDFDGLEGFYRALEAGGPQLGRGETRRPWLWASTTYMDFDDLLTSGEYLR